MSNPVLSDEEIRRFHTDARFACSPEKLRLARRLLAEFAERVAEKIDALPCHRGADDCCVADVARIVRSSVGEKR